MAFWKKLSAVMKIVFYDKHGCGQSERERKDFTLQEELLDLETIVNNLQLEKIVLFGISMAGATSIAYAAKNPEKIDRLILYGTYSSGDRLASKEFREAFISIVKANWGIGSRVLTEFFVPNATTDSINQFAKFMRDSATAEMAAKLLELTFEIEVTDLLGNISMPTLVLHRSRDKAIPIQHGKFLAQNIPNCKFKVLDGNHHFPFFEQPEQIIRAILEFLEKDKIEDTKNSVKVLTEITEQSTIVFTDIISSTDVVTSLGDSAARDIFLKHDEVIRSQLKRYNGRELQNLGDGFMLSFRSASAAIKFSCGILREIAKDLSTVKIRIGINTGEVVLREGDHPFGHAVVVASRISQKCKGGQILVADVTKKMVAGSTIGFNYQGAFKLKGIRNKVSLYEVVCGNSEDEDQSA
jgi:pimeloyl-ACP methyl ester carboxylesterase/class 3 adenylate cyclase